MIFMAISNAKLLHAAPMGPVNTNFPLSEEFRRALRIFNKSQAPSGIQGANAQLHIHRLMYRQPLGSRLAASRIGLCIGH